MTSTAEWPQSAGGECVWLPSGTIPALSERAFSASAAARPSIEHKPSGYGFGGSAYVREPAVT